mmetsp:Transcript_7236/g.11379  ORF Transcript_7236/g.11379 Transcript_7236/m.11379 type:complete len:141 (+) Transcript_7236:172-594(+)
MKMEAGFVDNIAEDEGGARIVLPMSGEGAATNEAPELIEGESGDLNMSFIKTLVDPPPEDEAIVVSEQSQEVEEVEEKTKVKKASTKLIENEHFTYRTLEEVRGLKLQKIIALKMKLSALLNGEGVVEGEEERRSLLLKQ